MPALPKLFAEHGILSQVAASLRSWTRLGPRSQSSSKNSKDISRPRTVGSAPGKRSAAHGYRLADEDGNTQYGLTELTATRSEYVKRTGGEDGQSAQPGIVKTVEVDHHDDAASKSSATPIVRNQHP